MFFARGSPNEDPAQFTIFGLEPNVAYKVRVGVTLENLHDRSLRRCESESAYIDQRTEMYVIEGAL